MKKLLFLILLIPTIASAQWIGGTVQGITSGNKQSRINLGSSGYIYIYTKGQLDSLLNLKQNTITLTTTGSSGAATLIGGTLNIPQYSAGGGSGTVTALQDNTANGVSITWANRTTTPTPTVVLGAITPTSIANSGSYTQSGTGVNTFTGVATGPSFTGTTGTAGFKMGAYTGGSGFGALYSTNVTPGASNFSLASNGSVTTLSGNATVNLAIGNVSFFTSNGTTNAFTGTVTMPALTIPTGAVSGRVWTSNAIGVGSWQPIGSSYKGTWDASTNTPTIADGVGTLGDYYVISVGGTSLGRTYVTGGQAIYNGSIWQPVGTASGVTSFASRTGAISPVSGDYSAFYPLLNGTGATGIWGIGITGNSATATALATTRTIGTLTGDVTSVGSSFDGTGNNTNVTTLATVNSNVGTFGSSTSIPTFTVNAKGLITAASGNAVIAPAGTLTGTSLASNVLSSSLTSVGTIGTGVWNGTAIGDTYISSAANWNTAYTNRITSLTNTGSSGASTLTSNVLNIPTYTLAGLGGQSALSGTGFVKITGTTISYDNSSYYKLGDSPSFTQMGFTTNSTYTSFTPVVRDLVTGVIGKASSSDFLANIGGQTQLSGTGFLKFTGTTPSYDNTTYNSGSGTIGYVTKYTGSNTQGASPIYSNANTSIVIGSTNPSALTDRTLTLVNDAATSPLPTRPGFADLKMSTFNNGTNTKFSNIQMATNRGTEASSTAPLSGDILGVFYTGFNRPATDEFYSTSYIRTEATENLIYNSNRGSKLIFGTGTKGTWVGKDAVVIGDNGNLGVGNLSSNPSDLYTIDNYGHDRSTKAFIATEWASPSFTGHTGKQVEIFYNGSGGGGQINSYDRTGSVAMPLTIVSSQLNLPANTLGTTQSANTNNTTIATTAYVDSKILTTTQVYDLPSIAAGANNGFTTTTGSASSAAIGDQVIVTTAGWLISGNYTIKAVANSGSVSVLVDNNSGSAIDPVSQTFYIKIIKQ